MILRDRDADANTGNGLEERIYVLHDANYNVTALVDKDGEVIERYYYEAYGSAVYLDDAFALLPGGQSEHAWLYLHQGGRLDSTTGNYHFRHRDLSPTLGRWISQDPIGFEAGDANLYRYVGNAVTVRVDPIGLKEFEIVFHYYFQTVQVDKNVEKELNRILGNAMGRFGNKDDTIKVILNPLQTQEQYDNQEVGVTSEGGFFGIGSDPVRVDITLWENPRLPKTAGITVLGQGTGFQGSIATEQRFQEEIRLANGAQTQLPTAIAGAMIHEGLFHGVVSGHYHESGWIDSKSISIKPDAGLSDEAAKKIMKKFKLHK